MFKCTECPYETRRRTSFKSHSLMHKDPSEVEMHKCDHCDYETKYKSALKSHLLSHKDPSEIVMHQCGVCDYKSRYKGGCGGCQFFCWWSCLNRHFEMCDKIENVRIDRWMGESYCRL